MTFTDSARRRCPCVLANIALASHATDRPSNSLPLAHIFACRLTESSQARFLSVPNHHPTSPSPPIFPPPLHQPTPSFPLLSSVTAMLHILLTLLSLPLLALALSAPPSGALIVRNTGTKSGEYSTISAAVKAAGTGSDAKVIFVYAGTYTEQGTFVSCDSSSFFELASRSLSVPVARSLSPFRLAVYITRSGSLKIYGQTSTPADYTKNTVTIQVRQEDSFKRAETRRRHRFICFFSR